MSKMIFEVHQKNGAFVTPRLGATNHSEEVHVNPVEFIIGGVLLLASAGFIAFLLIS